MGRLVLVLAAVAIVAAVAFGALVWLRQAQPEAPRSTAATPAMGAADAAPDKPVVPVVPVEVAELPPVGQAGTPAARPAEGAPMLVTVEARPVLWTAVEAPRGNQDAIAAAMGQGMERLQAAVAAAGARAVAPPLAITRTLTSGETWAFELAVPVDTVPATLANPAVRTGFTPAGRAFRAVHTGGYGDLVRTYGAIADAMKAQGLEPGAVSWEEYVSEPTVPEAERITNVYWTVE